MAQERLGNYFAYLSCTQGTNRFKEVANDFILFLVISSNICSNEIIF